MRIIGSEINTAAVTSNEAIASAYAAFVHLGNRAATRAEVAKLAPRAASVYAGDASAK